MAFTAKQKCVPSLGFQIDHFIQKVYAVRAYLGESASAERPPLTCVQLEMRENLDVAAVAFKGGRGAGRKMKAEGGKALIINSAEFWSWEARGKYIDVRKMLIKERSTLLVWKASVCPGSSKSLSAILS